MKLKSTSLVLSGMILAATAVYAQVATPEQSNLAQQRSSTFAVTSEKQFDNLVHQYILKNPEVVIEAFEAYKAKQLKQAEQEQANMLEHVANYYPQEAKNLLETGIRIGEANQSNIMVEFMDPLCGYCKKISTELDQLTDTQLVLKPLALFAQSDSSLGKPSLALAAAYKQFGAKNPKAFKECYKAIMTADYQQGNIQNKLDEIQQQYKQYGADFSEQSLKAYQADLDQNMKHFQALKFRGTPAMIIHPANDYAKAIAIPGYVPVQNIQAMITEKFAKNANKVS
ncbi:MAG: thioredoxin fold domain-containing protein [Candidatus Comchoanobacterales bacterium]